MDYRPPRPVGDTSAIRFFQGVWDMLWGGKFPFIDQPGICEWSRTTQGYYPRLTTPKGRSAPAGSAVKMFKITSLPGDDDPGTLKSYFLAKEWDGTSLTGADIAIAKQPDARPINRTASVLGTNFGLIYYTSNTRSNGNETTGQNQAEQLVMPFEVGQVIFAAQSANGTGVLYGVNRVMWIDLTPRVWAYYLP